MLEASPDLKVKLKVGYVNTIQSYITLNLINTPLINNMFHIGKNTLKKCFDIKTWMDGSTEKDGVANNI